MPIFFSQITEVEREKAKRDLLDLLDSVGFTATSWPEGSIPSALVDIGAEIWSKSSAVAEFLKNLGLNDMASAEALTRFSKSHYENVREAAVATQRSITLACEATEGPHTFDVGDVVVTEPTGRTFRNVAGLGIAYPATLNAGGTLALLFEAEVAGDASNVTNGSANIMVTTFAGVTVTADTLTRLGIDEESDTRLKLRNSTKWATLSISLTREGVIAVALKAAPAVVQVEVDDQNPRGEGTFDTYVAGTNATAGATDVALVQAALANRFFQSDASLTRAAPEVFLDLVGTVYYDSTFAAADVQQAVEDPENGSLYALLAQIPLGGFNFSPGPANIVPKNDIEAVIKDDTKINGLRVVRTVVLSTPTGDLSVLSYGKVVKGTWALTYTPVSS